ncbi:KAP family P-loop NTPase fold protein [Parablautia muri]|uniref:KAP NTPase domain-containing protein n=1 Tax=Parablautia muri TaxID=2320879 RepID=A0A9X5BJ36_9FIRM|nr:P-loop NTPase fold protein [Parablautia muri]NBJ94686.1 hypothetical protein [Parablautia muri]
MWTDNASKIDMLFYKPYADIVSETAIGTDEEPLTVGIFGLWGAGKSTLLNLIGKNYEGNKDAIYVSINAWMFENYEDAKTAIMEALLRELKDNEKIPIKIRKSFVSLIKKIDFLKVGTKAAATAAPVIASFVTGNPLPLVLNLPNEAKEIETAIKSVSDSVRGIKDDYLKDDETVDDSVVNNIRNFRNEFEKTLESEEINRVVVLIDDLDRCQPERIIETLEAIKLFLSVKKTTFIIAADENVIQYAIKKKYPNIDGFNIELDKEYIEKMIQVPIQIPELSPKDVQNYLLLLVLQKYMEPNEFEILVSKIEQEKLMVQSDVIEVEGLEEIYGSLNDSISFEDRKEYKEVVGAILQIRKIASHTLKGNPRQIKRFLNTFILKRKLSKMYYGDDLDMCIMAKLLILHKLNPDLFNQLNVWNSNFNQETDSGNEQYKLMRQGIEESNPASEYQKWYKPRIKAWVMCPPVELEKENLDRYFYLTREILIQSDDLESNLSEASKAMLDRIGHLSAPLVPRVVNDMRQMNSSDLDDVMTIIIKRIEKGNTESYFYASLFKEFTDYRRDIIDGILKDESKIEPSQLPSLKSMYTADQAITSELLDKLLSDKRITQAVIKKIKDVNK